MANEIRVLLASPVSRKYPVNSLLSDGDGFASDCAHHHAVFSYRTRRVIRVFVPQIAGFSSSSLSLRRSGDPEKRFNGPPRIEANLLQRFRQNVLCPDRQKVLTAFARDDDGP
jgi:hypothetical protein